jgi:prepilin-type N-terminal cleavage/methylation domain-containing protein
MVNLRREFLSIDMRAYRDKKGLTLIELLIALVIAFVLISAAYRAFSSQQKSYTIQNQVTEMQQVLRVVTDMMVREIRMAGYIAPDDEDDLNNDDINSDVPGEPFSDGSNEDIEEATASSICFEADLDDDGETETVRYFVDPNGQLQRQRWEWDCSTRTWVADAGGPQLISDNIVSMALTYTFEDGQAGLPGFQGDGTDEREDIRMVHLTLVARTFREDPEYRDGLDISGSIDDGTCRTRTITANIRARNMGMSGL